MRTVIFAKVSLAAVALVVLGSCSDSVTGATSFQSRYGVARTALESGNYDKARRAYTRLLQEEAGPLTPRLQLEYAHTELRSGNFQQAASLAAGLVASQKDEARAAALSVQGTAQHELGLRLLSEGKTAEGKAQLQAASAAFSEVLKQYSSLDPLGSMAGRRASIEARLKPYSCKIACIRPYYGSDAGDRVSHTLT
ncbi:tetratricopeptide repeat protein [Parasedimentitalea marina]|nr:tetratricopeptide repeat protein [Parasedimentitalea marina]